MATNSLDGCTVTTFHGGPRSGPCVQITGRDADDAIVHLQLTSAQAVKLANWLIDNLYEKRDADADVGVQDQARKRLLARMAGNVASGLVLDGVAQTPNEIAAVAVHIADRILHVIDEEF